MGPAQKDPVVVGAETLVENFYALLEVSGMKPADLARRVKAAGGPSKKTIYNILNRVHPPNIETWGALAKALHAPLWVVLVPGLKDHKELLTREGMARMERLMENYLEADPERRAEIETVAAAAAIARRARKHE